MDAISLRNVEPKDWFWIETWFQDDRLNRQLGPVDTEWLDHVLAATDGVHLVAIELGKPIGLIGIVWATPEHPFHGITDLAVRPGLRREGYGRRILSEVLTWHGHPDISRWVAFVALDNEPAINLLQSSGWIDQGTENAMKRFGTSV